MVFEVTVLLFGPARELVGTSSVRIPAKPVMTTDQVKRLISERHPMLKDIMAHCVLAVGQQYRHHDERLHLETSTEVALIPPISGG